MFGCRSLGRPRRTCTNWPSSFWSWPGCLWAKRPKHVWPLVFAKSSALGGRPEAVSKRGAKQGVHVADPEPPTARAFALEPWRSSASEPSRSSDPTWSAGSVDGPTTHMLEGSPSGDATLGRRYGARSRRPWRPVIGAERKHTRNRPPPRRSGAAFSGSNRFASSRFKRACLQQSAPRRPRRPNGPKRGRGGIRLRFRAPAWPTRRGFRLAISRLSIASRSPMQSGPIQRRAPEAVRRYAASRLPLGSAAKPGSGTLLRRSPFRR